jgi:hypothetical protein
MSPTERAKIILALTRQIDLARDAVAMAICDDRSPDRAQRRMHLLSRLLTRMQDEEKRDLLATP